MMPALESCPTVKHADPLMSLGFADVNMQWPIARLRRFQSPLVVAVTAIG